MNADTHHDYKIIITKVPAADREKFKAIAQGLGQTLYKLVQSLALALVRYFDRDSLITYEHNTMLNAFADHFMFMSDTFNPLSFSGRQKREIEKAIVFVTTRRSNRPQVMAIGKDGKGNLTESYNIDQMLEGYLKATDPELLKVLTAEKGINGDFSLSHTLHDIVLSRAAKPADRMEAEIKELFDDVRIPTGEEINRDVFYKQKYNKGDYTAITPRSKYTRADI